jgi:ABC-type multidrug transport system permease subunit
MLTYIHLFDFQACLLLDEPTSGLDSTSAVALIQMLQHLARTQRKTVITSIHQPNSALFRSFDKLIMLAEGHVVYFGTPRESLGYLRDHAISCPDGYNLADHWMDLLVSDSAIEEQELLTDGAELSVVDIGVTDHTDGTRSSDDKTKPTAIMQKHKTAKTMRQERRKTSSTTSRQQLIDAWDGEAVAEQMDMQLKDVSDHETGIDQSFNKYNASWVTQYTILSHRALKNSRSAIFTPINLIKSAVLGIIVGLLWFQLEYTEATVFDRSSYYFFTMTYWVFDAMFQALIAFPAEREVILKERASGSYHLSAYFMAKTTSEMPTRLVLPLIYMCISFWMAGISTRVDVFVFSTLISLLSVVAGESIGLLVGASIYDMEKAMATMTVVALALALLGGFFVENVPDFIAWGKFISPFKYSFDAARQLAFDRAVPCDGSGALEGLCSGGSGGSASAEDVIDFLNIQGSVGFNVGLLVVLGLVPRYIAYLALRVKKEGER